jgi:type II secretory ATPase GspE/PulE/Tfp pilus assembly ATPase PilB-like protein
VHLELVFCYKVVAGLNINETSKPQDKKAVLKIGGADVQFRVTTIPGDFGETVAISFKFD